MSCRSVFDAADRSSSAVPRGGAYLVFGLAAAGLLAAVPTAFAQDATAQSPEVPDSRRTSGGSNPHGGTAASEPDADGGPSPLPERSRDLDPPSTGSELGSMLLETLLVLVGVCLLAYVVLRWGVSRLVGGGGTGDGPIEVLARQPLGTDSSILVVRIGPKTLIVGDGESGMTRLGELDDEQADRLAEEAAPDAGRDNSTPSWMSVWLEKTGEST